MTKRESRRNWRVSFLAVVRYELLWNIRKKKIIGVLIFALALATLTLALPVILNNLKVEPNPNYVITTGTGIGGMGFFLFALVSVMNSISGEFESGSIVLLLTKPVSRTTIYLGKIFAAFLTVLAAYTLLIVYLATGGYIIYGPQNNLDLLFITLLGSILSTLVWISIVLAMGSVSKSSMLTTILGIGIWFGLYIVSLMLSAFSTSSWILTYAPGNGATGTLSMPGSINQTTTVSGISVPTGTDGIATSSIAYILHPTDNVTFTRFEMGRPFGVRLVVVNSEPLSMVVARSIAVAAAYIFVFNFIAWYALKRAQVEE